MKKLSILLAVLLLVCAVTTPVLATQADAPLYISGDTYYDSYQRAFMYYVDNTSTKAVYSSVADGMITAQQVSVKTDAGVAIEVYLNGARLESISGGTFQTPGEYVVMYAGGAVSARLFTFTIVPAICNYVTGYSLPVGFEITEATLNGTAVSYDSNYVKFAEEGQYSIKYRCIKTDIPYELQLQTDFTGPILTLEEVTDGFAQGPVDISEARSAAVVNIYRDGEKVSRKDILTESGTYMIELADEAGNKTTYNFTILIYFDGNSWLFILLVLVACIGVVVYLLHSRRHLRVR